MKTKRIIVCLLTMCFGLSFVAEAADTGLLIRDRDFENGTDGFGISYSGRDDTTLPYIFHSSDTASSGNYSLEFVSSKTLTEKTSASPQSMGIAYQGIYNTEYISVEKGRGYTVSADFYTEGNGIKMRFIQMDGNKAVAMSPETELQSGVWQTQTYKWTPDAATDKNRVRVAFYNISKNKSVYIDNFSYSADYIPDSSWEADEGGIVGMEENGFSYTAPAEAFKKYRGVYAEIDKSILDENKKYVLSGYIDTDMKEAALYVSADNIDNCFSEYEITPDSGAYVNLCFDPSECKDSKIMISITAAGTSENPKGKISLTNLKISETDTSMKLEQKDDKLFVSGQLRKGNDNRELSVNVTDKEEFSVFSDGNGAYKFSCDLPDIQKSKGIFVSIRNINGYSDCGDVICGYTEAYNNDYRNETAKTAGEMTSSDDLKAYLTDEVLKDMGILKIKNFRIADKNFVFDYLPGNDISTYEKLEEQIKTGSIISRLSTKDITLAEAIEKYGMQLKLDSVKAYKNEYGHANKSTLESLFRSCTTEIKSINDLHYMITELLVKEKAGKAANYSEIMNCVTKYSDDLSLDFREYNALSMQNKYTVANSFTGYLKTADSFKTLQARLDKLVAEADNSTSGGTGGGGSNGSSGSKIYDRGPGAQPVKTPEAAAEWKFSDLKGYEWADESIYALTEKGVVSKSPDKMFRPADKVTRAEFAKMIALSFGFTASGNKTVFDDVDRDDWYFDYITALYENNIVNGMTENHFGADEAITRQDVCVILARIKGKNEAADISDTPLTDISSAADYAKEAIVFMNGKGFVNGYEDGSFRPYNNTSRAEAAKLIYSIIK